MLRDFPSNHNCYFFFKRLMATLVFYISQGVLYNYSVVLYSGSEPSGTEKVPVYTRIATEVTSFYVALRSDYSVES